MRDGEGENRETDGSAMITPEEEGYAPFKVDFEYMRKHKPQVGGYFVQYEDGYKSFSPAEPFESGYTRETSDFKPRLEAEKSELEEKLNKLDSFLMSEKVNSVDDVQKALLQVQATAMNTYLQCLKERIERL